jgi:hypothetical protein
MLLRSGTQLVPREKKKTPWPVIPDKKQTFETWDQVEDVLKSNTRLILLFYDKTMHRMICVQTTYLLLNNKKFLKDPKFQRILKCMLKVLHRATDLPEYVAQLVPRLEKLQLSVRRWGFIRASCKLLDLHSRAVVTANHPSRIDFSVACD